MSTRREQKRIVIRHQAIPKAPTTRKVRYSVLGYIMVETLVAMTILSISSLTIHRAVYQAVNARRQAQELTIARHLMEHIAATVEMRPELLLDEKSGNFGNVGYPNYIYTYSITRIDTPIRGRAARFLEDERFPNEYQDYMGKLTVNVYLNTAGSNSLLATGETLLLPGQLWLPKVDR